MTISTIIKILNHQRIFPLILHSSGTLHQGDDLMKSSSKHLFVDTESPKYPENPFKRISFVHMHISQLQLIKAL